MLESQKKKRIVLIVLIIVLLGCLYMIKDFLYNSNEVNNILNTLQIDDTQITERKTERVLQVEELQKENSDIIGWVEIEGTHISYPVVQGINNDYYMTHSYKKEDDSNGSIFLDKDYDWNLPSTNLLIYGHNNQNGIMFAKLLDYKDEEFYKKHQIIRFTTNSEDSEYEIIAVFLSRVYYKSETDVFRYYYFINAENEKVFNEYIEKSKEASLYNTGKTAQYGDQLLTLSTCSYHIEDGRLVVVTRKVNKKN